MPVLDRINRNPGQYLRDLHLELAAREIGALMGAMNSESNVVFFLPPEDPRAALLGSIVEYRERHGDEAETVERFARFVAAHPDCFCRELLIGHVTGSAWIVNAAGDAVLLTHHRKLDRWLQPGGHADGVADVPAVALREAEEESGLNALRAETTAIFDLDIHRIPARGSVPEHDHYDVRYAIRHLGDGRFTVSEESHDLAWVPIERLAEYTEEASMHRMAHKWLSR